MVEGRNRKELIQQLHTVSVNPFINRTIDFSFVEKIKFVIALFTLIPFRICVLLFFLLLVTIFSKIAVYGLSPEDMKKPLSNGRKRVLSVCPILARIMLFFLGVYWVNVKGKRDPNAKIIVPNHVSFFDAMYIYASGNFHFVAKKETSQIPLFGSIITASQTILVDRLSPSSRSDTSSEIKNRAKYEGESSWFPVVLFPEGTTTNGSALISFKAGAFAPAVPVQPVLIRYPYASFDPSLTIGISPLMLLLRAFSQFAIYMEVNYLPLYHPNEKEKLNPILFANNVKQEMGNALGVPITDHCYEDVLLHEEAVRRNFPTNKVVLAKSMKKQFNGLTLDDMKRQLREFSTIDEQGVGRIDIVQYRQILHLPDTPLVNDLFSLLDIDGNGFIEYREYIAAKALASSGLTTDESLRMAFSSFDEDGNGYIDKGEFLRVMRFPFPDLTQEDSDAIFNSVDRASTDVVDYDEFAAYLKKHPEYMRLFLNYNKIETQ